MKCLTWTVAVLAFLSCVNADLWNANNNPSFFDWEKSYQYLFEKLPLKGQVAKQLPWSDTYWPNIDAGIAHRWNSPLKEKWNYTLYTKEQLLGMTSAQISILSPAEKYDIFAGEYTYPTVHTEWTRTKPTDEYWEGLCNGWSQASSSFINPNPVSVKNADGIVIPFGSSDVKALLSYWVALFDTTAFTSYIGMRCNYNITSQTQYQNTSECADMNAGAFHVAITNQLGIKGAGFAADIDRSIMIWNQPIAKYDAKILSEKKSQKQGVEKEVLIKMVMYYSDETDPSNAKIQPSLKDVSYEYWVEIDANGTIVGGEYTTFDRLDFAWKSKINPFSGYMSRVRDIYNAATYAGRNLGAVVTKSQFEGQPFTLLDQVDGKFELSGTFKAGESRLWRIKPKSARRIGIKFTDVDTSKTYDTIRIFEGENGPLRSVISGKEQEKIVEITNSEVYVSFTSVYGGQARFTAVYYST
jgi:hypothetical protein